ncbi:tryptophan synthase beta subunit-like PLP-dependent enzyme [Schizophyllum commune Tattone D]|nr:tryptophan synthase beta subunit-like PLP-dependent enzyme [Schizophyllum commune Tattone D]
MASAEQENIWSETPTIYSSYISKTLGCKAYLKLEYLQPSHSFKYRGISHFVKWAQQKHGPNTHAIIASGGNAGLAAACAANILGVKCTVYLPEGAAQNTIDLLEAQNAKVVIAGRFYAEAFKAAQEAAASEEHAIGVPAYDHEVLWEGHASIIDELAAQLKAKPDAIFCSVGGGSMLGGILVGCKKKGWDDVYVRTMETNGSDCFHYSVALNRTSATDEPLHLPANVTVVQDEGTGLKLAHFHNFSSRASGSLGASQPAAQVVKMALEYAGGVRTSSVPDALAVQACVRFADEHKVLVELACGATLTAAYKPELFNELVPPRPGQNAADRTVVFIVCGGFKVSLAEMEEYRKEVAAELAEGGSWDVLNDQGRVIRVEK